MKRVKVAELTPGMITAEDVYNYNDQLVLQRGLTLDEQSIQRLETFAIMSIRIDDGVAAELAPEQPEVPFDETPYSERVKASEEFKEFKSKFEEHLGSFKESMNDIVQKGVAIDADTMLKDTVNMLNTSSGRINIFDMLQNMRQYDDLTYAHCINVALICNVFAGWLRLSPGEVEIATLCGVFHDIGKLSIPDEIVKKPGRLTDEEFKLIRTHTVEGFRILQHQDIDIRIKRAALLHHERCDGSGYPLGFTSCQIDKFSKIVAIADVYDAMTASRVYRGPLCPFKVIEIFEQEGLQCYEAEYILTFLEKVVTTYMGNTVRLADGREGRVVFINKNNLSRPMLEGKDGQFIDLSKEKSSSIEMIL